MKLVSLYVIFIIIAHIALVEDVEGFNRSINPSEKHRGSPDSIKEVSSKSNEAMEHYDISYYYYRKIAYEPALIEINKSLDINKKDQQSWHLKALILDDLSKTSNREDKKNYEILAKQSHAYSNFLWNNKTAQEKINTYLIINKSNKDSLLFNADILNNLSKMAPNDIDRKIYGAKANYFYAYFNYNNGSYEQALEKINISLELNGLDPESKRLEDEISKKLDEKKCEDWNLRGKSFKDQNKITEAISAYKNATNSTFYCGPDENFFNYISEAYLNLGRMYLEIAKNEHNETYKKSNISLAIEAFEKSHQNNSSNYYAWINESNAYKDLGDPIQKHYCRAMSYFIQKDKVTESLNEVNMSLNGTYWQAYLLKGNILEKNNYTAEAYYYFAYGDFIKRDWPSAHYNITESIKASGPNGTAEAWCLNGSIFNSESKIDEAIYCFNKSNSTSENDCFSEYSRDIKKSEANLNLGRIYGDRGEFKEALDCFNRSINNSFSNYDAWTYRGIALLYSGDYEEAQKIYRYNLSNKGILDDPKNNIKKAEIMAKIEWYHSSISTLSNVIDQTNATNEIQDLREVYYNIGTSNINLGNYDYALQNLTKATRRDVGNETKKDRDLMAKAWMNMAIINANRSRYDSALEDIDTSLEFANLPDAWYAKGLILLGLKMPDEAIDSFSEALRIEKNNSPKAWDGKGRAYAMKDRYQDALDCYTKALSLNRFFEQAWIDKGTAEKMLHRDGESFISFYNALKAIQHNRAKIWCDIGYAHMKCQNINRTQSLNAFNKSIGCNESAEAHYNKSLCLLDNNNLNEARKEIMMAARLRRSYDNESDYNYNKGRILNESGHIDEAHDALNKSYKQDNLNLDTIFYIKDKNYTGILEPEIRLQSIKLSPNDSMQIQPANDDIEYLKTKLNNMNITESLVLSNIADAEYKMGTNDTLGLIYNRESINQSIQYYMKSRKLSAVDVWDWYFQKIIHSIFIISILGFLFILYHDRSKSPQDGTTKSSDQNHIGKKVEKCKCEKPACQLVLINIIGFSGIFLILSNYFDISKAFYSLMLQAIIGIIMVLFFYLSFNAGWLGWLDSLDEAIKDEIGQKAFETRSGRKSNDNIILAYCNMIYNCILSNYNKIIFLVCMITIASVIITTHGITYESNLMRLYIIIALSVVLLTNMILTAIPLMMFLRHGGNRICDNKICSDIAICNKIEMCKKMAELQRKKIAALQFFYLSILAVPLSWLTWSLGAGSSVSAKMMIEDISLSVPLFTMLLILLFIGFVILPYLRHYRAKEEVDGNKVYQNLKKGFISPIIGPFIAVGISLLMPLMPIPVDQPGLTNLIVDAICQTTLGF